MPMFLIFVTSVSCALFLHFPVLMEFYFNVSRNKCSFSFQSDVFVQGIVLFPSVSCKYFAHCFFSFPLFVSFISYAFSSLFEYCDRIKHIACFLLCLISKLLSTSVCSSLYLFLALESSVFSFFSSEYWLIVNLIPHELFKQFHLTIALVSRSIGFS